jgi:preprotein translocase SecE subunit
MADDNANVMQRTEQFFKEVWHELQKVNWTSWEQLKQSTRVVILGAALMAVYLGLADMLFSAILKWFLEVRL